MVKPGGLANVLPPTDVEKMTIGASVCLAWSLLTADVIAGGLAVTGVEGAPKVVLNLDVEVVVLGAVVVVLSGSSSRYACLWDSIM